jgi:renalase
MQKIAILGAGFCGLVAAHALRHKYDVTVFEKARGVGGRMSTRYADPWQFDHGAQFFTARTKAFQNFIFSWIHGGVVQKWNPDILFFDRAKSKGMIKKWDYTHYIALPKMNYFCKALCMGWEDKILLQTHIETISKQGKKWQLVDKAGTIYDDFDFVICTAPAPQAAALFPHMTAQMESVKMLGCYSLMLGFKSDMIMPEWQAFHVHDSNVPAAWGCFNQLKSGREQTHPSLIVHAGNEWAEKLMDADQDQLKKTMHQAVQKIFPHAEKDCDHVSLHRWRYAATEHQPNKNASFTLSHPFLQSPCHTAFIGGDWTGQGTIESAFTSARAIIEELI